MPILLAKLINFVMLSVTPFASVAPSGMIVSLFVNRDLSAKLGTLSLYIICAKSKNVLIESSNSLLAAEGI